MKPRDYRAHAATLEPLARQLLCVAADDLDVALAALRKVTRLTGRHTLVHDAALRAILKIQPLGK